MRPQGEKKKTPLQATTDTLKTLQTYSSNVGGGMREVVSSYASCIYHAVTEFVSELGSY